jgi:hypothetical protein
MTVPRSAPCRNADHVKSRARSRRTGQRRVPLACDDRPAVGALSQVRACEIHSAITARTGNRYSNRTPHLRQFGGGSMGSPPRGRRGGYVSHAGQRYNTPAQTRTTTIAKIAQRQNRFVAGSPIMMAKPSGKIMSDRTVVQRTRRRRPRKIRTASIFRLDRFRGLACMTPF